MTEVSFFHQERADGGRRTGLDVDGTRALRAFEPGGDDSDPRLVWFVDVSLPTAESVTTADDAADWLSRNAGLVQHALQLAADELSSGIDSDVPWQFEFPAPDGPGRVTVSAIRRVAGQDIRRRLLELSESRFGTLIRDLSPVS